MHQGNAAAVKIFIRVAMSSSSSDSVIPAPYRKTPYDNPAWVLFVDPDSSKPYFFHTETGETSWEDPEPPLGLALFEATNERQTELVSEGKADPDTFQEDVEKNFHLQSAIEAELDRGTPPYLSDDWRRRPARKQAERDMSKIAYREGSESYNVWYHRYSGQRPDDAIRQAATSQCDPWLDSGWTLADSKNAEEAPYCMWFAKGSCSRGSNCRYKHRVPTREDDAKADQMVDVFGRERHSDHKNDMGGVGSFMKECRALYVSEIQLDRSQPDNVQRLEAQLWKLFHPWGPIESIRVIPNRLIAFVKFEYRSAAEFAKVACANQPCGLSEAINVRWAFEDPNPRAAEQAIIDTRDQFFALVEKRIAAMSKQERIDRGLLKPEERKVIEPEEIFETSLPDNPDD